MKGEVNFDEGFFKISIEEARQIAASAWCQDKTKRKVMDPALAEEFARILQREITLRVREAEFETIEDMTKLYEPKLNEYKVGLNRIEQDVVDDWMYISGIKGKSIPFAPEQITHFNIGDSNAS